MIIFSNVYLCLTPLASVGEILRTRDRTKLSFLYCAVLTVVNGCWTLFGLILEDLVIFLPSLAGYLLCLFQLEIVLWTRGIFPADMTFLLYLFGRSGTTNPVFVKIPP